MKIALGSDKSGFSLKEAIKANATHIRLGRILWQN